MDYRILGPLEVADGQRSLSIPAGRERAVLILLVLRAPDPVPVEAIIDALWPDEPPASAGKIIQNHILRLRKELGHDEILTIGRGYALRVANDGLDANRAASLVANGREALRRRNPGEADRLLSEGLALWRGDALVDVHQQEFAQSERARLEELKLSATEDRNDAQLLLGEHSRLLPELEQQVLEQPLRERLRGQLMLALYRSGRQSDALAAYQAARELLDERGLEPSRSLRELEFEILNQDPRLEPPAISRTLRPWLGARGRRLVAAMTVSAVALVLVGILALTRRASDPPVSSLGADSVAEINPSNGRVKQAFVVGRTPTAVALTSDAVWVTSFADRTITRIDLHSKGQHVDGSPSAPTGLAAVDSGVWVISSFDGTVERLDRQGAGVLAVLRVHPGLTDVAADRAGVWVTNESAGSLIRIDPRTNEVRSTLRGFNRPIGVAIGAGRTWVAEAGAHRVDGIDPATGGISARVSLRLEPGEAAFGSGSLWVANPRDATVTRINPYSGEQQLVSVGATPSHISVANGSVWVTVDRDHSLVELDARTGAVKRRLTLSAETAKPDHAITPGGIAAGAHSVWMSVQGY